MPKMLKKDLQEAMQPLRRAMERIAIAKCNGERLNPDDVAIAKAGVDFHGYLVRCQLLTKSRVSCNVPAPYHIYHLQYRADHAEHGVIVQGWEAGSFRDQFFLALKRKGLFQ